MTRGKQQEETLPYIPELERHLTQLRKYHKATTSTQSLSVEPSSPKTSSESDLETTLESEPNSQDMAEQHQEEIPQDHESDQEEEAQEHNEVNPNQRRTIREATSTRVDHNPFLNAFPTVNADYEIKGLLIQNLPKFYDLQDDEAINHLDELFIQCNTIKPARANVEDVMWRVFHLTLEGKANQWYMGLPIYDPHA